MFHAGIDQDIGKGLAGSFLDETGSVFRCVVIALGDLLQRDVGVMFLYVGRDFKGGSRSAVPGGRRRQLLKEAS